MDLLDGLIGWAYRMGLLDGLIRLLCKLNLLKQKETKVVS